MIYVEKFTVLNRVYDHSKTIFLNFLLLQSDSTTRIFSDHIIALFSGIIVSALKHPDEKKIYLSV